MANNTFPFFGLGSKQSNAEADHDANLGQVVRLGREVYRFVRAAAQITSPANKLVATALASNVPSWVVNTTTTAADYLAAGIIPNEYTSTIEAGDYFWLQVAGPASVIANGIVTAGSLFAAHTDAGEVATTTTYAAGTVGVFTQGGTDATVQAELNLLTFSF